jgi:hypothetical protein
MPRPHPIHPDPDPDPDPDRAGCWPSCDEEQPGVSIRPSIRPTCRPCSPTSPTATTRTSSPASVRARACGSGRPGGRRRRAGR